MPQTTKRTAQRADPAKLAARIVAEHVGRDTGDQLFDDELAEPGRDKLLDALKGQLPDHARKDLLSLDQVCAMQKAIGQALPESLRAQFRALGEWYNLTGSLRQEAAYLLGIEMGRRLGGASAASHGTTVLVTLCQPADLRGALDTLRWLQGSACALDAIAQLKQEHQTTEDGDPVDWSGVAYLTERIQLQFCDGPIADLIDALSTATKPGEGAR